MPKRKAKILIVDDAQINRIILCELLRDQYQILEAEDGKKALEIMKEDKMIDLVLLDIVMPNMDGYQVLEKMKEQRYLEYLPVIIISSEGNTTSMEKAYELGATDYIRRPFESYIINRRIKNTLMLYEKQKKLVHLVEQQVQKRVNNNTTLINVLGHIVEFRNGESGLHIQHIQTITKMLLLQLGKKSHEYKLSDADILLISTASSLHDIGKISIDEKILNKPGRLTKDEFEIVKQHSSIGAEMLKTVPNYNNNDLLEYAYQICRWHHERYDGHGYPDGLVGDQIPISAQVVSIADVYDALTSERCYKKAYSHEQAMKMIVDGQCGVFNPLLLECLCDISEEMKASLFENENYADQAVVSKMTDELVIKQFRSEMPKEKNNESQNRKFFQEMTFEYDAFKDAVYISSQAAKDLGIDEIIYHPKNHEFSFFNKSTIKLLKDKLKETTHLNPEVDLKIYAHIGKQKQWYHLQASTRWNGSVYKGFVGKLVKDNNIQVIHNIQENISLKYTYTEIKDFIESLKDIFTVVRLIDFQKHQSAKAENDQIEIIEGNCYDYWKRKDVCVNCISKQAYIKKGQAFKLEFVDYNIYAIIAQYVEVDERPWVLELVYKTKEDIILGAHGKTRFLKNIVTYNKEYYTDVLTGAYSRRYYEEYVQYINDVSAVAMIDADNFKAINDQYGHNAGDQAIKAVSKAIQSCIRPDDIFIRYGGDEFILIFQDIHYDAFTTRLYQISECVKRTKVDDYEDLSLSITIGGIYGNSKVNDAIKKADKLMYEGKKSKCSVVVKKTSEVD